MNPLRPLSLGLFLGIATAWVFAASATSVSVDD